MNLHQCKTTCNYLQIEVWKNRSSLSLSQTLMVEHTWGCKHVFETSTSTIRYIVRLLMHKKDKIAVDHYQYIRLYNYLLPMQNLFFRSHKTVYFNAKNSISDALFSLCNNHYFCILNLFHFNGKLNYLIALNVTATIS